MGGQGVVRILADHQVPRATERGRRGAGEDEMSKAKNKQQKTKRTRQVLNRVGDAIKAVGRGIGRRHWGRGMTRQDVRAINCKE